MNSPWVIDPGNPYEGWAAHCLRWVCEEKAFCLSHPRGWGTRVLCEGSALSGYIDKVNKEIVEISEVNTWLTPLLMRLLTRLLL